MVTDSAATCNCHFYGCARYCAVHTQADFDAQDANRTVNTSGGPVDSFSRTPGELEAARQEVRDVLAADQAAAEAKDKAEGGLERRYHVERLNDTEGKHSECRYFVLDPQHDPIAREALKTYANHAYAKGYVTLHDDLMAWLRDV